MSQNNFFGNFDPNQQQTQGGGFQQPFGNAQELAKNFQSTFGLVGHMIDHTKILPQNPGSYVEKWIFNPYVRSFFDIDNIYIIRKMKLILFPFLTRGDWEVKVSEYGSSYQEQNHVSPKDNPHAPDLYLPLMGLITFVLVSCLSVGIGDDFQPEIIQRNTSYCLFITFLEIYLFKFFNRGYTRDRNYFSFLKKI